VKERGVAKSAMMEIERIKKKAAESKEAERNASGGGGAGSAGRK